jgi:hypothetical protein
MAVAVAVLMVSAAPLGAGTGAADEVEPGAQLAGVVGVQSEEVENEVAQRTLSTRLERANGPAARAAVVASETEDIEARLATLRERRDRLEAAYEAGNVSRGQYRARLAQLTASIRGLERRAERTRAVAADLPEEARERKGVNVSAIDRLRGEAGEMTGQEVRDVARSVVGEDVGNGLGPPDDDERPGRSDDAPGRDGDGPGRGDDAPGRDDDSGDGDSDDGNETDGGESGNAANASAAGAGDGSDNGPGDGDGRSGASDGRSDGGSRSDDSNGSDGAGDSGGGDGDGRSQWVRWF